MERGHSNDLAVQSGLAVGSVATSGRRACGGFGLIPCMMWDFDLRFGHREGVFSVDSQSSFSICMPSWFKQCDGAKPRKERMHERHLVRRVALPLQQAPPRVRPTFPLQNGNSSVPLTTPSKSATATSFSRTCNRIGIMRVKQVVVETPFLGERSRKCETIECGETQVVPNGEAASPTVSVSICVSLYAIRILNVRGLQGSLRGSRRLHACHKAICKRLSVRLMLNGP